MSTWRQSERPPEPRRISEPLDSVTARLGAPAVSVFAAVFGRWEELVGPDVATHARPSSLRRGVLVVDVDQAEWAAQLRFLAGPLMERIAVATGSSEVVEIRFRVAGDRTSRAEVRGRRPDAREPVSDPPLWYT